MEINQSKCKNLPCNIIQKIIAIDMIINTTMTRSLLNAKMATYQ